MLEIIRRYWIGLLVLVLVGIHASIVGVIRHQASLAKIDASCEVDLGQYLAFQMGKKAPLQMRIHAIVPLNHRMKSRQLIDLNKTQIRQSLEEYLRQLDSKLLTDPYLADLKSQLLEVMIQTIGNSSIDDLVVTELRESNENVSLEFVAQGNPNQPRKLVATLRDTSKEGENEEELTEPEEDPSPDAPHDEDASDQPEEPVSPPHATPSKAKAKPDSHGAAAKKPSSHGTPSSHGSASIPKKAAAKSSGHGAGKTPAKDVKKSSH